MSTSSFLTIAIDGAAASGKSSTAKAIAKKFHFLHVDTGTHYRALTVKLLEMEQTPEAVAKIKRILKKIQLSSELSHTRAHIQINGETFKDEALRSIEVNMAVPHFAAIPEIREFLVAYERTLPTLAKAHGFKGIVMEGRDIGTVVLPHAHLIFFLEADPAIRAERRAREGFADNLKHRDHLDTQRKHAPLVPIKHAIVINTDKHSLEQTIEVVIHHINQKQL
jgi:cytidylate kinase